MTSEPHRSAFHVRISSSRFPLQRVFLWLALPLYLAYALLVPPFQTPDEQQHLFRAWQLAEFRLIGEARGDKAGGVLPGGLAMAALPEVGTLDPHVKRELPPTRASWLPRQTQPHAAPDNFHNFLGSVNYSPVSYLPQIATIKAGQAAGWAVETILLVGRVANIFLFVALFTLALRLTPWGAPAFLFLALHPTSVSAVATFGQDGIVFACAALLVASGLRLMLCEKGGRSSFVVAGLAASGVALTKFLYLPLLATAGVFGRGDLRSKLQRTIPLMAVAGSACLLATIWLAMTSAARVPPIGDVPAPGLRLQSLTTNPGDFTQALIGTFTTHGLEIVAGAYRFGWLNVGPVILPMFLTIAAFQALLLVGGEGMRAPKAAQRAWLLAVGVGTLLLVCFAVWIYYTPIGHDRIRGFQSRYLIPIALVMFPAILPRQRRNGRALFWMVALLGTANFVCLMAIAKAFYTL